MTTREQAVERLTEMLRFDEVHNRDCCTADPIAFPCDCDVPELLRTVLTTISIGDDRTERR